MPKILVVQCMQEISSFNPLPSEYENFLIEHGGALHGERGRNTALGGAFAVFEARPGVEVVPCFSARAGSAGLLSAAGWQRLSSELMAAVDARVPGIDAVYVSLHGAMGADGELDPEGWILSRIRERVGPGIPIVISLDLHGICTDRMLRQVDGFAIYWTYPHVDFADTGRRAAELLLRLVDGSVRRPTIARVVIPALVRGDELITRSGCYGDLLLECRRLEGEGVARAAGIMIGNPFTDVPELCSQVLVMTDADPAAAELEAKRLAEMFWPLRHRMQGKLVPIGRAIAQARTIDGPVIFTDAADATSSGATGDSNVLVKALHDSGYRRRVLAQLVDPAAAEAAHRAGVGASIEVELGGAQDRGRFAPWKVRAEVALLSNGRGTVENTRAPLDAGRCAVLTFDGFTIVVLSRTVGLHDRAVYFANGLHPQDFDLIVVKSPHTEYHMYDAWVAKNFNVDAPGSTSANLPYLGHRICARPIYPMEPDVAFTPSATLYSRAG
ncbi:MAG: M81 family metallopeptidase [Acetobacteraceae bacterium]|nr:M81 family metallopeptidase [Acetobacteraceae bacterium]